MRRISVWEVLGAFLISVTVAVGVSASIGAINRHVVENEIEEATSERHLLRVLEGSEPASDGEQSFRRAFNSLETILRQDQNATVGSAFGTAEALGSANPEALNRIVPNDRWSLLGPLTNADARQRLTALDAKYHLAEIIRGNTRPSEGIAIRTVPPMWTRTEAIGWYLAGCVLFALIYGIRAYLDRKHPIINAPWGSVPSLLAFTAAAPVTIPSVALYGVWRIFVSDIPWNERWSAFSQGVRVFGYRMRLLRRLPSPVIGPPTTATEPSRVVAPASAQPAPVAAPRPQANKDDQEARQDADTEEDEDDDEDIEWFVIHPDEILGREHLLTAAEVKYFPISIAVPEPLDAFAIEA